MTHNKDLTIASPLVWRLSAHHPSEPAQSVSIAGGIGGSIALSDGNGNATPIAPLCQIYHVNHPSYANYQFYISDERPVNRKLSRNGVVES
jgi:hypothetical protein